MNLPNLTHIDSELDRRHFLGATAAGAAMTLGAGSLGAAPTEVKANDAEAKPENLVADLYESLTPKQRESICFGWDQTDERSKDMPLRLHVSNNWRITRPGVISPFFTRDQQEMIEAIFFGLYDKQWHGKVRQQLKDDAGGYGKRQSIAIFGEPGSGKFELVMTGRHLTIRCDGDSTEHFAFGGPIFYGHAARGFNEKPDHPGNVFWPQAVKANKLYEMLDGKQRDEALLAFEPAESEVHFQKEGKYPGLAAAEMSADQREHLTGVLDTLLEPYRESDRKEVHRCLKQNGGLEACSLSFYETGDIGEDKVWDNWRLEGPSFVWYFRGAPHVHVWVNVASDPSAKISAEG
ncbi:DUF3500 domain-containing protein [Stratiformator vulcanicus]|uniref:DUF3500 domain-containing protein n=1 Tax=Stratiformator vulcanicus TaxID=2527980 RepID=A0A517R3L5_9PLAN|nr:DUF3500 domain-containing protein [Stratiformator vulcanicus]QDT38464.1 hypothetical protein Pan189_28580 [Stratiformator vulcanicus]